MKLSHAYRSIAVALLCAISLTAARAADGTDFPSQTVKIISTNQAGGGSDLLIRAVAEKLGQLWGKPIIVDPRPGANGMLAASIVAKAPADGYTLLTANSGHVTNTILVAKPPYKLADFSPISQIVFFPFAVAVRSDLPVKTFPELIAYARATPGKLSYASHGIGASSNLLGELLKRSAKIDLVHIPYKGEAPIFTDLLAGNVDIAIASVGGLARQSTSGKVRVLAVASPIRLKSFPDIPTLAELGYADVSVPGWSGLFAPAGTPQPIVDKISADIARVLKSPDLVAQITDSLGAIPVGGTPQAFGALMASDFETSSKIIEKAGIKLE